MLSLQIDWKNFDANSFAVAVLQSIWGGTIPRHLDPIKKVSCIIKSLSPEEKEFWKGSVFLPKKNRPLDQRIASAVRSWVGKNRGQMNPFEFCGFSLGQLKKRIESQFRPGMSWDNWGEWHIDHIIPRARYLKPYSREEVFGLQNLQPLWASENYTKASKHDA